AARGLVVEAEDVAADPAPVGLRDRQDGVDGDGGVRGGAARLERFDPRERRGGMGGGHHAVASEGDRAKRVADVEHGRQLREWPAKSRVISSCGKRGKGAWRAPSTSVTPCSRGTTWPMKWQSIDSRASAWMTMPASAGASVISRAPLAM